MFIVVFVVMLPVQLRTGDPIQAWQAGLAWAFIIGVIVLCGALVGPWILRWTPRAAMLGSLAGISIAFIAMRPAAQMWQAPWIGLVAFAFILVGWLGFRRMPFGAPVGLLSVCVATAVGWLAVLAGWSEHPRTLGGVRVARAARAAAADSRWRGARRAARHRPLLATAVPLGVYNFAEGMSNVESAAAAGDRYPVRQVLTADGIGAIVGSFLGSPFRPPCTSATPAGSRWAVGSATRW